MQVLKEPNKQKIYYCPTLSMKNKLNILIRYLHMLFYLISHEYINKQYPSITVYTVQYILIMLEFSIDYINTL